MGVKIEIKALPAQPKSPVLRIQLGVSGFAQINQQGAVPLQNVVDPTLQRMQRIGLAVVPDAAGIVAEQLVASAGQPVTTFLASMGFDSEHAANKKPHQVPWSE